MSKFIIAVSTILLTIPVVAASYGDPDVDKDGICDPWVAAKGLSSQYEMVCTGIDLCSNEPGPEWNQGCPLGNPDADEDGVCDAWVSEKGLLSDFEDVCEGIDLCPNEPGERADGCPEDYSSSHTY